MESLKCCVSSSKLKSASSKLTFSIVSTIAAASTWSPSSLGLPATLDDILIYSSSCLKHALLKSTPAHYIGIKVDVSSLHFQVRVQSKQHLRWTLCSCSADKEREQVIPQAHGASNRTDVIFFDQSTFFSSAKPVFICRCDVFTAVRKLRAQRQGMIQELVSFFPFSYIFPFRTIGDRIGIQITLVACNRGNKLCHGCGRSCESP